MSNEVVSLDTSYLPVRLDLGTCRYNRNCNIDIHLYIIFIL